jgi:hypothetical protein
MADFSELLGKTFKSATSDNHGYILFETVEGVKYKMHHRQDCCETVSIESIAGDLSDLVGNPILVAEESFEAGESSEYGDSSTWTFYKLGTVMGWVDIRWFGTSNGYYSETADLSREDEYGFGD